MCSPRRKSASGSQRSNRHMSTIQVGGQLQPGTVDTPLDARARVDTVSAVAEIPLPFIGMTFFVKETGKLYVVKSLKSKQIGPVVTENAAIDEYEELPRTWDDIPGKPETFPPAASSAARVGPAP